MYALLYKPPCGKWYVHSHKLYADPLQAEHAADKFLSPGTPYVAYQIDVEHLDEYCSTVNQGGMNEGLYPASDADTEPAVAR